MINSWGTGSVHLADEFHFEGWFTISPHVERLIGRGQIDDVDPL
jgi:hypothetical protein